MSVSVILAPLPLLEALAPLGEVEGLSLVEAPSPALVDGGGVRPLRVVEVGLNEVDGVAPVPEAVTLALVRGVLDDESAHRMEDLDVGFVDSAGRAWVPGLARSRTSRGGGGSSLGSKQVRVAQLLTDHPDAPWTEAQLAEAAGASQSLVNEMMLRLEREGVVERRGRTRAIRRRVDVERMRRWLIAYGRPHGAATVACFVPDMSAVSEIDVVDVAFTGAAGAAMLGSPVLRGAPTSLVRVASDDGTLSDIPSLLGGFRTDRGANVTLIADPDRLGFTDDIRIDGARVASPSRVALDLFLEPRGESAVDAFLHGWPER